MGDLSWDLVVDTWTAAPAVATAAAQALAGRTGAYAYVSSQSVYTWGDHVDEDSPLVDGDPTAVDGEYPALKRGAEIGVTTAIPKALVARCGLILGPHEDIGRLPWWLNRIARGGDVVAPGQPGRPLQYIDVRDLAVWMLTALEAGVGGPVDAVGPSGHATTGELLEACIEATGSEARLVWIPVAELEEAGVEPWTHLPCWVPPSGEYAGFLEGDTSRARAAGLYCRPIRETVRDTWKWLQEEGPAKHRPDRPAHGLPADLEAKLLAR